MVLFVAGEKYFYLLQSSSNSSGTHPVFCQWVLGLLLERGRELRHLRHAVHCLHLVLTGSTLHLLMPFVSCMGTDCGLIVLEVHFFLKILVTVVAAKGICVCVFNDTWSV